MQETVEETLIPICEVVREATAQAIRSERTSRVVRGLLGAQERKRRKVDTDQISRLRNEVADLKRQSQAKNTECMRKDEMIATLSDRMEEMLCQMDDLRIENKANQEKILALLTARL